MHTLDLVLLIIGALCFFLVTLDVKRRVNLLGLGLLAWISVPLIAVAQAR